MNKGNIITIKEFADALATHAPRHEIALGDEQIWQLCKYYELVMVWNQRLHLVAPCSPTEFATRHVLESLTALPYLSSGAHVLDIGSGAGLPIIPCLIMRPDINATLIEASRKKSIFLREALRQVERHAHAIVIADRFENISIPQADFVTCRALERFSELFSKIVAWSPPHSTMLFFAGLGLREQLEKAVIAYSAVQIPGSEQRFLFVIKRFP